MSPKSPDITQHPLPTKASKAGLLLHFFRARKSAVSDSVGFDTLLDAIGYLSGIWGVLWAPASVVAGLVGAGNLVRRRYAHGVMQLLCMGSHALLRETIVSVVNERFAHAAIRWHYYVPPAWRMEFALEKLHWFHWPIAVLCLLTAGWIFFAWKNKLPLPGARLWHGACLHPLLVPIGLLIFWFPVGFARSWYLANVTTPANFARAQQSIKAGMSAPRDPAIQRLAEAACNQVVKRVAPKGAYVLVSDAVTGRLLAVAQHHAKNPKLEAGFVRYEPGAIVKAVTLAGALDAGVITPEYRFNGITGGDICKSLSR